MFRFSVVLCLFLSLPSFAQKKELTLTDAVLRQYSTLAPVRMYGLQWIPNSTKYAAQMGFDDDTYFIQSSIGKGLGQKVIGLKEINQALNLNRKSLPAVQWKNEQVFEFQQGATWYQVDTDTKKGKRLLAWNEKGSHVDRHAASKQVAYTIDNNLYITKSDGTEVPVTQDPKPDIVNGQAVHRSEFGITKGTFWSPSGKALAFYRMDESMVTNYPMIDNSSTPAAVYHIKYPMAGQASHHVKVGVYNVKSGKTTFLETGTPLEQYLTCVTWGPEDKYIYVALVNRDQNHVKVNQYDAKSGKLVKTMFEEKQDKYVEPEHQLIFLPNKANEFLWWSERDGFMHLYHYNTSGKLIRQVTKGNWEVEYFRGFGKKGKLAWVLGTANQGLDRQIYEVNLKKGTTRQVTKADGTHHGDLSPDGKYLLDTYNNLTTPRVSQIIDMKGKVLKIYSPLKIPLLNTKWLQLKLWK